MSRRQSRTGLIDVMLLLVAIVWGSTYLTAKELVTPSTVISVLALRFVVTLLAMFPFCVHRLRKVQRVEILTGMFFGLILAVIFLFETFGIAHTTATNAGLIISLTIVMTPILDSAVNRSWLPPRFFVAAAIAVVGVGLLAAGSGLHPPSTGDWLILVAAVVRAIHVTVMHKMSTGKQNQADSLNLTYIQMTTVAVLFCLISPLAGGSILALIPRFGLAQWLDLLYLALVCTVFAFFVQMWAVRTTSPSRVSLLLGTEPIWALLVGVLLGGDRPGTYGLIGAIMILLGAGWGQRLERRHRQNLKALAEEQNLALPALS